MSAAMRNKRIQKEVQRLVSKPIDNIFFDGSSADINLNKLVLDIVGATGTVYENEKFKLQFTFPPDYPLSSPEVIFIGSNIPMHEHVYTNGHICLDILYDKWTPVLTIETVCLSLLSMLSSAKEKKLPPDNDRYLKNCMGKSPKQTRWWFHDDRV